MGERYIVYGFIVGTGPCANLADAQLKRTDKTSVKPFGKSHHRYVHSLRTKEVIAMRKQAAYLRQALADLK